MLMLLGELDADDELGRDDNELNSDDALDITTTDADDSTDTLDNVAAAELFSGNLLNFLSLIDLSGVPVTKMMTPLILTDASLFLSLNLVLIFPL